jgi:hypothetical protein
VGLGVGEEAAVNTLYQVQHCTKEWLLHGQAGHE